MNDTVCPCRCFIIGQGTIDVLNVRNDASMVMAPPIGVGIINFMEELLQAIVCYAKMVQLVIDDHGKKKPLKVVAAPLVVVKTSR